MALTTLGIVIGIAAWFVGYSNMISALIFIGLKCMGMAVWQVIIYMLVADTIEYGNYKSGTRATGITFALQCFIAKMKNAFLASFVLFMLGFIGFVEGENAVQPAGVADGLFGMFIFIVMVCTCVVAREYCRTDYYCVEQCKQMSVYSLYSHLCKLFFNHMFICSGI